MSNPFSKWDNLHMDDEQSFGNTSTTRQLKSLSVEELCGLLTTLDLGKYAAAFRAFPVNGSQLSVATYMDLLEVGVASGMHRRALLQRIEQFNKGGVPVNLLLGGEITKITKIGVPVNLLSGGETTKIPRALLQRGKQFNKGGVPVNLLPGGETTKIPNTSPNCPIYIGCMVPENDEPTLLPMPPTLSTELIWNQCACCSKVLKRPYFKCNQCRNAGYCGTECQTLHWGKTHKKECKPPQTESVTGVVRIEVLKEPPYSLDDLLVQLTVKGRGNANNQNGFLKIPSFHSNVTMNVASLVDSNLVFTNVGVNIYVRSKGTTQVQFTCSNEEAMLCAKELTVGQYIIAFEQSPLTKGSPGTYHSF